MPPPQLADELENAYRSEIWNPAYRHTQEQKQGIVAARTELFSSSSKVGPQDLGSCVLSLGPGVGLRAEARHSEFLSYFTEARTHALGQIRVQ